MDVGVRGFGSVVWGVSSGVGVFSRWGGDVSLLFLAAWVACVALVECGVVDCVGGGAVCVVDCGAVRDGCLGGGLVFSVCSLDCV